MAEGGLDGEFPAEEVEGIVKLALGSSLQDVHYDPDKVAGWSNAVIDGCLKGLTGLGRPFKFVVTCIIMQRTGAGLHTAAGAFWDTRKDGISKMVWENATVHCVVTVFGMALAPSAQQAPES